MEYRSLGRSGLQVSVAGLGCNNFGRRVDAAATANVVSAALDHGITLFDTADSYGPRGLSEEYLGRALGARRQDIVLATKFASPMGEGPLLGGGASRRYIMHAVEASLRRLGTDYIDLYQVHWPDAKTPLGETLRALDDLVRAGKVRYIGNSNHAGWQVADAGWIARTEHLTPFVTAQNDYSLLNRSVEKELVPACLEFGLSVLPYFPLASGMLTGKYRRGEVPPEGTRFAGGGAWADRTLNDRNFDKVDRLEVIARDRGLSLTDVALGWLAAQPAVGSVIAGATKPEQIAQNVAACLVKLDGETLNAIDEATKD
jgi:aryl-alcohol dehydrogenase-like predicted oxidoreductase